MLFKMWAPSIGIAILSIFWGVMFHRLERRDAALNIEWPRLPIPDHGRITTIQHSPEMIDKFVHDTSSNVDAEGNGNGNRNGNRNHQLLIAPQVDIYYEALLTENCTQNFVILPGTNSQTFLYQELIDGMQQLGFCTLVFDWRSHGRSEDTPGDITTELFMLDAAAIITKVFGKKKKVHVFGWSLGGFVGYQLAIYKPELVASLFIYGSSACWAPIADGSTECVDSSSFAQIFFSRGAVMRLIGLKTELLLAGMAIKLQLPLSNVVQRIFYSLRMDQKVKTPRVWLQVQGAKTFSMLDQIQCPFQQLIGEHEHLVTGATKYSMELEAMRIAKAEPPIVLKDTATTTTTTTDNTGGGGGGGYSHFAMFEAGGFELIFAHLQAFYEKHAAAAAAASNI